MKNILNKNEFKNISQGELMLLGLEKIAYLKNIEDNGEFLIGVYTAAGKNLGVVDNVHKAQSIIVENNMFEVTLH